MTTGGIHPTTVVGYAMEDGVTLCTDCAEEAMADAGTPDALQDEERASPIFAGSEWDRDCHCETCGELIIEGMEPEESAEDWPDREALDALLREDKNDDT